MKEETNHAEES